MILGRSRAWRVWRSGRHDGGQCLEYGYGSAAKSLREAHGWSLSQTFWLLSIPAGDGIDEFGVLVRRALPAGPRDGQPVPPHPTVDRRAEIGQDGVAGYEDHVDVQSGVGGDKVAAICIFIGPLALRPGFVANKSIDFFNLWPAGFLPYGVARSPLGADQRRSTNTTSKFR
jgi:hypothetical protein